MKKIVLISNNHIKILPHFPIDFNEMFHKDYFHIPINVIWYFLKILPHFPVDCNEMFHKDYCHIPINLLWNSLYQKFPHWGSNSQNFFLKRIVSSALLTELSGIHIFRISKMTNLKSGIQLKFPTWFFACRSLQTLHVFPCKSTAKMFQILKPYPWIISF